MEDLSWRRRIRSLSLQSRVEFFANESIRLSTDEATVWESTTRRFLDTAFGSLTPQDWNAAEHTISWWTRQRTREGVKKAWSLLDRLVDEERHQPQNDTLRRTEMTDGLNRIADARRILVERETHHQTQSGDFLMEANEIFKKLDGYKPCLLPDAQTYSLVMDAVTTGTQGRDGAAMARFAEQILERMQQEAYENPLVLPTTVTYNSVINAWTKNGVPEGPEKAEDAFRRMKNAGLNPTTISFSSDFAAWAGIVAIRWHRGEPKP
jgi:pentatricopeptide repeat protein